MNEAIKILLVEDNPSDLELATYALKKRGLSDNIKVIRDGAQALDFLFCRGEFEQRDSSIQPDVIFLDLKLPKLTGIEVLEAVRAHEDTEHIPVIIITSSEQQVDIQKSYALGANSYVTKPVEFEQFVEVIGNLGAYWVNINRPPKKAP
jgi:two-component system response regulator